MATVEREEIQILAAAADSLLQVLLLEVCEVVFSLELIERSVMIWQSDVQEAFCGDRGAGTDAEAKASGAGATRSRVPGFEGEL